MCQKSKQKKASTWENIWSLFKIVRKFNRCGQGWFFTTPCGMASDKKEETKLLRLWRNDLQCCPLNICSCYFLILELRITGSLSQPAPLYDTNSATFLTIRFTTCTTTATSSNNTSGDVLITFTQNTVVQLIKNVKLYKELKFALVRYVLFTYNSLLWLYYIIIFFKYFVLFFFKIVL